MLSKERREEIDRQDRKILIVGIIFLFVCATIGLVIRLVLDRNRYEDVNKYKKVFKNSNEVILDTGNAFCEIIHNNLGEEVYLYMEDEYNYEITVRDRADIITVVTVAGEDMEVYTYDNSDDLLSVSEGGPVQVRNKIEDMINNYASYNLVSKNKSLFNSIDVQDIGYVSDSGIGILDSKTNTQMAVGKNVSIFQSDIVLTCVTINEISDWTLPENWYQYYEEQDAFIDTLDEVIDVLNNIERRS